MAGEHPSLLSSAAAAPAAWTRRLPRPPAGLAAAPACRRAPRQPAHQGHMTVVLTPQRIYSMTGIKVRNVNAQVAQVYDWTIGQL